MKNLKQIQMFTKDECDYMLSFGKQYNPHNRYTQRGISVQESYVRLSLNPNLKSFVLNKFYEHFNLIDIHYDEMKFIKYMKGAEFGLHVDSTTMKNNPQWPYGSYKTIIIMMNDGSNYEGGDLIMYNDGKKIIADKTVGNVLFYDSDIPHEVTEVTSGTRISCLILLSTKDFKLSAI